MALTGVNPTDGDECDLEYGRHVCTARRRVRWLASKLDSVTSTDNGFMAAVFALRVLGEAARENSKESIAKTEVAEWEEAYLKMFERLKKKFPKKIDPEQVKNRSLEEFERLRATGINLPKHIWGPSVTRDLRLIAAKE